MVDYNMYRPLHVQTNNEVLAVFIRKLNAVPSGAAQRLWRWGGYNFFDPLPLAYLGDMKQDIAVFFTAIMTSD